MTEQSNSYTYQPPVDRLLSYGDCNELDWKNFPDYVTDLGLSQADVPELMRMMTDEVLWNSDADTLAPWGVVHAWRSLAQLKAMDAIEPFIALMDRYDDDDWLLMDAFKVLGMYGEEALPTLAQHLADATHSEVTRSAIAEGIEAIAKAEPDQRDRCIEILTQQLSNFAQNGKWLNGSLVGVLVELNVVEAAPLIEQAFAAKAVDDSIPGSWPSVQVELGLKQESDFSEEELTPQFYKNLQAAKLLRNPNYQPDRLPMPDFDPDWLPPFDELPPSFGEGFLSVPKSPTTPHSKGFGSGASKGKKKKKK
jgi:hypothetical protein